MECINVKYYDVKYYNVSLSCNREFNNKIQLISVSWKFFYMKLKRSVCFIFFNWHCGRVLLQKLASMSRGLFQVPACRLQA